jgi:hypothetical protein
VLVEIHSDDVCIAVFDVLERSGGCRYSTYVSFENGCVMSMTVIPSIQISSSA